jgi:hypothetical protein
MHNHHINWAEFGIQERRTTSLKQIQAVEQLIGYKFPELYKDLILFASEASPEEACFSYGDGEGTSISEFFACTPDKEPMSILWYIGENNALDFPDYLVAFARDAGDYLICFNYQTSPPSVVIVSPCDADTQFVAESFEAFIELWQM